MLGLPDIYSFDQLPYGAVIAIAELVDCLYVAGRASLKIGNKKHALAILENGVRITEKEFLFGDYTIGRYAWLLANVRPIIPAPARGRQRLWEWSGDYE